MATRIIKHFVAFLSVTSPRQQVKFILQSKWRKVCAFSIALEHPPCNKQRLQTLHCGMYHLAPFLFVLLRKYGDRSIRSFEEFNRLKRCQTGAVVLVNAYQFHSHLDIGISKEGFRTDARNEDLSIL